MNAGLFGEIVCKFLLLECLLVRQLVFVHNVPNHNGSTAAYSEVTVKYTNTYTFCLQSTSEMAYQ